MAGKLRKLAKGRECQIRIPGVCNGSPETVVLCHLNGGGIGRKRHDIHGAWGCSSCHDAVDGRMKTPYSARDIRYFFLDAVIRTQEALISEGEIQ